MKRTKTDWLSAYIQNKLACYTSYILCYYLASGRKKARGFTP